MRVFQSVFFGVHRNLGPLVELIPECIVIIVSAICGRWFEKHDQICAIPTSSVAESEPFFFLLGRVGVAPASHVDKLTKLIKYWIYSKKCKVMYFTCFMKPKCYITTSPIGIIKIWLFYFYLLQWIRSRSRQNSAHTLKFFGEGGGATTTELI